MPVVHRPSCFNKAYPALVPCLLFSSEKTWGATLVTMESEPDPKGQNHFYYGMLNLSVIEERFMLRMVGFVTIPNGRVENYTNIQQLLQSHGYKTTWQWPLWSSLRYLDEDFNEVLMRFYQLDEIQDPMRLIRGII